VIEVKSSEMMNTKRFHIGAPFKIPKKRAEAVNPGSVVPIDNPHFGCAVYLNDRYDTGGSRRKCYNPAVPKRPKVQCPRRHRESSKKI
jgi:hypothetical protein